MGATQDFSYEHNSLPLTGRIARRPGAGLPAFTTPDVAKPHVPGTAYDPLLDHLSLAQATTFFAATLRGVPDRSFACRWRPAR
jgi:hypothetical protein